MNTKSNKITIVSRAYPNNNGRLNVGQWEASFYVGYPKKWLKNNSKQLSKMLPSKLVETKPWKTSVYGNPVDKLARKVY